MQTITAREYQERSRDPSYMQSLYGNSQERQLSRRALNSLVSNAFGVFARGDFTREVPPSGYFSFCSTEVGEKLGQIGRVTLGRIPLPLKACIPDIMLVGFGFQSFGRFMCQDGSVLQVYTEHLPQAQIYAQNYEKRTNRPVTIIKADSPLEMVGN